MQEFAFFFLIQERYFLRPGHVKDANKGYEHAHLFTLLILTNNKMT